MFARLGRRGRVIVAVIAAVVAVALIVGVAFLVKADRDRKAEELAALASSAPPVATIDPQVVANNPTATEQVDMSGNPGHVDGDHSEGMKLTAEEQANIQAFAEKAVVEYVTFDSAESPESRAARLAPYLGTGPDASAIPVLANGKHLDRNPENTSKVTVSKVNWTAMSESEPGDAIDSLRFTVALEYVADWGNPNIPGAIQTGGPMWEVYVPIVQGEFGGWGVGDVSTIDIVEPSVDIE